MRQAIVILSVVAAAAIWVIPAEAQNATAPTTRPFLDQLNRETTALYQQVQTGLYHVQLPEPNWVSAYAMATVKDWDKQLDPELRHLLRADPAGRVEPGTMVAGPTTQPAENDRTTLPGRGTYLLVRPAVDRSGSRDPVLGGTLLPSKPTTAPAFAANTIGLLLDSEGHVLVPQYVEREAVGAEPVKLSGPDGAMTAAKFVGSDRQTNLTLLQVDHPAGTPVRLGATRPDAGSLVMCLSPADGAGHLAIWTDGAQENAIVLATDGKIAGIARYGQFLTGSACQLIARQLIQYGSVPRATLGVLVTEVRAGELQKNQQHELGKRSAMRIDQVIAHSAAEKAGLRTGDLVLAIGNESVSDLPSFAAAIAACDGPTPLRILRASDSLTVTVQLDRQK